MTLRDIIKNETLWYQKASLIETYHYVESIKDKSWRIVDTATALGLSKGYISEELKLANAVRNDDSIKKLSRNTALKRIRENGICTNKDINN